MQVGNQSINAASVLLKFLNKSDFLKGFDFSLLSAIKDLEVNKQKVNNEAELRSKQAKLQRPDKLEINNLGHYSWHLKLKDLTKKGPKDAHLCPKGLSKF